MAAAVHRPWLSNGPTPRRERPARPPLAALESRRQTDPHTPVCARRLLVEADAEASTRAMLDQASRLLGAQLA